MGWGTFTRCALALLLACAGGGAAWAETRVDVCVARGAGAPASLIAQPDRFDCRTPQADFGPGDYWVLSRALPADAGLRPTLVRSYSLWEDGQALWALYADGRVVPLPAAHDAASIGTAVEHALPVRGQRVVRLLWRTRRSENVRGIVLGVRLSGVAERSRASVAEAAAAALVAGLCAAFLFCNLALWVALRRSFQLAYCTMVGGLLAYVVGNAGLFGRLLPAAGTLLDLRVVGFTVTLCIVGGLWFARTFLEPHVLGRRGNLAVRSLTLTILGLGVLRDALAPWQMLPFDRMQGALLLAVPVSIGFMAWRAWRRRSAFRWVWAGTTLVPMLLAVMRGANTFNLVARPFAMQQSLLVLMAAGMLLATLAIAWRIHLLARELAEARAEEVAARRLADTDPLTGLMNRRAFLAQALGRPGTQKLLIADLDHFKAINETLGHDGGDEVLRAFAATLAAALPPGALAARIGGEEFAIVADAGTLPPRVVTDALAGMRMPFDLSVTASIGTCTGPLACEADWKALYRLADRALFAAKAAGRDRVRDGGTLTLAA